MITQAFHELLTEMGFRKVEIDHHLFHRVKFTCAMGQTYILEFYDTTVYGLDPHGGVMKQWDLNDPDSIPQISYWCWDIRRYWRAAKLMIRGMGIDRRINKVVSCS